MPDSSDIVIEFQLTKAEIKRGLRAIQIRRNGFRIFLAFSALLLVVGEAMWLAYHSMISAFMFWAGGIWLVAAALGFFLKPGSLTSSRTLLNPQSYKIGDVLHCHYVTADSVTRWSMFDRMKESKEFFLLYTNKRTAVILPKRAFSGGDKALFRELARVKLAGDPAPYDAPPPAGVR